MRSAIEDVDGRGMAKVAGRARPGKDDRRTLMVNGAMVVEDCNQW